MTFGKATELALGYQAGLEAGRHTGTQAEFTNEGSHNDPSTGSGAGGVPMEAPHNCLDLPSYAISAHLEHLA